MGTMMPIGLSQGLLLEGGGGGIKLENWMRFCFFVFLF